VPTNILIINILHLFLKTTHLSTSNSITIATISAISSLLSFSTEALIFYAPSLFLCPQRTLIDSIIMGQMKLRNQSYPQSSTCGVHLIMVWRPNDARKRQAHKTTINLHKNYGLLVRMTPKFMSVGDPAPLPFIYNVKDTYTKVCFRKASMRRNTY